MIVHLSQNYSLFFSVSVSSGQDQSSRCPVQNWTPNKAYEFEYHGRLLTGLPSLSAQYSGIGLRATVKVFAKTADILILQVQEPKYVDVNNVLHPSENGADNSYNTEGWNWRNLNLPPLKQVSYSFVVFSSAYNNTIIFVSILFNKIG